MQAPAIQRASAACDSVELLIPVITQHGARFLDKTCLEEALVGALTASAWVLCQEVNTCCRQAGAELESA